MAKRILPLVLILFLAGCLSPVVPPKPSAQFTITSWEQNHYEYFDEYGYVYVYFNIANTGSVEISYYQVYIQARCADGSIYQDWTNGSHVAPGHTLSDWTLFSTAGKRVVSVAITAYELWGD